MKFGLAQLTKGLFGNLQDRYREVVELRFGLVKAEPATLAAIGDKYGVTRERIRQLEAIGLQELKKNLSHNEYAQFIKAVIGHLKGMGGVRKESDLLQDLRAFIKDEAKEPAVFDNQIRFLLSASSQVALHNEDREFYKFWYVSEDDVKKTKDFIVKLVKTLKNQKEASNDYLSDLVSANYIGISKKFTVNAYGDFGLTEWPEIAPQNARDWAYLVLGKAKKPMHFLEIATVVNKLRNKSSNPQTIHNELIKDDNFVLVGKGTYALKEHGYVPGVAWEVITRLLKKHGPLHTDQVVDLVGQERLFKKNTIIINLQNKNYFKRLEDGRYAVHEV